MLKEFSLQGKSALVTGGGRGIGKAIALVLAEAEADVAVSARTLEQVEGVAERDSRPRQEIYCYSDGRLRLWAGG